MLIKGCFCNWSHRLRGKVHRPNFFCNNRILDIVKNTYVSIMIIGINQDTDLGHHYKIETVITVKPVLCDLPWEH